MQDKQNIIIVFCTISNESKAAELARNLVNSKLAPCANIIPAVRSIYTWKGEVCDESEALIVIKTRKRLFKKLKEKISALHPYEVPEIIAFNVTDAHEPYLKWLIENTLDV